jgi:hypothetical protein
MSIATPPGRRGVRKAPAIPSSLPPEIRSFYEQVYALTARSVYHVDGWFTNNVGGGATNTQMTRIQTAGIDQWVAPRDGWVWTLWVKSLNARTAGTLTVFVFKNGTKMNNLSAVLDGVNTTYKAAQAPNSETMLFKAGDSLDIRYTTVGWTPTTADIIAGIEVEI